MAIKVGTLQVDLVANTASFTGPLDKAGQQAKKSAKDIQDGLNGMDLSEARGGLMLVDDLIGVHMPRHAAAFVAEIPGFAAAFSAMFPVVAVAVAAKAIYEAVEGVAKHREELQKDSAETLTTALATSKHADALEISNLKLRDQIGLLGGKLPQNGVAIAMSEAKKATIELEHELTSTIDKLDDLMKKQKQGMLDALLNGSDGSNDVVAKVTEFRTAIDDLTQNMETAAALKNKTDFDQYKKLLDDKRAEYRKYAADQQTQLNATKKTDIDTLTAGSTGMDVNGGIQVNEAISLAEATKQVNEEKAKEQRLINAITIDSESGARAQKAQAENATLTVAQARDKELIEFNDKEVKKLVILKQALDEQKKLNEENIDQSLKGIKKENDAFLKASDERNAFYEKYTSGSQKILTLTNEIADQEAVHTQRMAVATGVMTEQQAVQETLKTLESNKASEMKVVLDNLEKQRDVMERLDQLTNGGTNGTDDQNQQYRKEVEAYQAMKMQGLEIYKKFQSQIDAARLQAANNERSQWNKMFLDFSQLQMHMSQEARQVLGQMNSSIASFVTTGTGNFRQLATSAIESFIQMFLQYEESKAAAAIQDSTWFAAKKAMNASDANSSAARAAASTLGDVPFPANIPAAASVLAAGEGFAADALAEGGALLPNRQMMINTHPEEMILPRNISNFIVKAASNSSGSGGGANHHFVFAPNIQAIDATGVDSMLTKHQAVFHRHVMKNMRRMGFA
jgi:hypothetical protein